jgi:signal transduction histidine kinase
MTGLAETLRRPEPDYRSIARWALLLALPLVLVGLVAAQLIEADYAVTHARARIEAESAADQLGNAAGAAVTGLTQALRERLTSAQGADDVILKARSLLYTNEASAALARSDGRLLFPPEEGGWDLTEGMAAQVKALQLAADLTGGAGEPSGWYAGARGPVFFQCGTDGMSRQSCIALDWPHVEDAVRNALDQAAASRPGWSFRVRDPFDGFVWARGGLQLASGDVFNLSGAMRGWRISAAAPAAGGQGIRARLALVIPIAAAWFALVWSKVRQQRERIAESTARADLLAKLSHDLRTPLANLKLYSDLIARHAIAGPSGRDPSSPDKTAHYCQVLGEEIDRLDALADATIAFGTASRRVRRDLAAPDDVVHAMVARLGKLLESSGCRCEVDGGASRACRFDRVGFERILVNLIDNARKYAPGAIRITTALDARHLRLSVRDWGTGFSVQRSVDNLGLGLTVVRDLAKANGGAVELVPCAPGTRVDVTMLIEAAGTE